MIEANENDRNDQEASDDSAVASSRARSQPRSLFWTQFGLRDLFWMVIAVSFGLAWWRQSIQPQAPTDRVTSHPTYSRIEGPLSVTFQYRTSPNSTSSFSQSGIHSLELHPAAIVLYRSEKHATLYKIEDVKFLRFSLESPPGKSASSSGGGH